MEAEFTATLDLRIPMFHHRLIGVGLLVMLSVLPAPALGRTWNNAAGTSQLEGELVEARADGTVLIKRSDGKVLEVKLDRLSQADQDFVRQQAAAPPQAPNTVAADSSDKPAADDSRHALPDAKVVADKVAELRTLLKDDFDKARTSATKREAFLEQLTQLANESLTKDPAGTLAVASAAAEVAVDGGDISEAFSRLTWLEERFQLNDGLARRIKLAGRLKVETLSPEAAAAVTEQLLAILEKQEDVADYEGAVEIGRIAVRTGRRANDPKLLTQVFTHGRKLKEHKDIYKAVAASLVTLKTNPQDAAANLMRGKFLCLIRGQWDRGLPHLAAGGDTELAPIAKQDLLQPTSSAEQAVLADQWWKASELPKYRPYAEELTRRSAFWYRQALPELKALDKVLAEKRIKAAPSEREDLIAEISPPKSNPKSEPKKKPIREPKGGGAAGWLVLFRSADPSGWDSDSKEENRYTVPLERASDEIKFLKLKRMDSGAAIIIPMTKQQLRTQVESDRYGWIGTNINKFKGYHLGVFSKQWSINGPGGRGQIAVVHLGLHRSASGWGFGHKSYVDDVQCYAWEGQEIAPTIFEISVTSRPLSNADESLLLK